MLATVAALVVMAGPINRACPDDAPVVRTAEALHQALESNAPLIWIAGRLDGDFRSSRSVALRGCENGRLRGSGRGTVLSMRGDDVQVEDVVLENSGARVNTEDGALKITGARAVVRRIAVRDTLYGIAFEQCSACTL